MGRQGGGLLQLPSRDWPQTATGTDPKPVSWSPCLLAQKKVRGGAPEEADPRLSVQHLGLLPSGPDPVRTFPQGGSPPGASPRAVRDCTWLVL